ncbi:MAG: glycoside hydrolase family 47 protein [Acidomyces sp. 'richmondensis']|nr:MAG: glycoside hydrolase family 47 protein [Acidomyces sp. 'richmondensis']
MHRTRQLVFHALVATGVFARIPVNTTSSSTTSDDPAGPYTETQSIIEAPAMPATTTVTGIPSLTYSHTTLTSPGPGLVAPTPSKLPRTCKKVQKDFAPGEGMNQTRADAIRDAYVHGWNAYVKYAWGYDSLQPLTLDGTNDYYGWGVTVFDALDTAIVMNLTSIVFQQLDWIAGVDFTTTAYGPVGGFNVNIRYIGGMLSAYDMLNSGQFPNPYGKNRTDTLLKQAVVLADKLAYAFNTPTGIPASNVNFSNNQPVYSTYTFNGYTYNATNTAQAGTYLLEWSRLSDLTGNETYRYLAERANNWMVNPHPPPRYPGLVGTEFSTHSGDMLNFAGGWHSGVDSFLETWQYKPSTTVDTYLDFWLNAVESAIRYLALHPYGWPDLTFISSLDNNGSVTWSMDDFTDFAGGNYLLGGALLNNSAIVNLGILTTDGAHVQYNRSTTGLGAIGWQWFNSKNQGYDLEDDTDIAAHRNNDKYGFWIPAGDGNWQFRPEEVESIMYAHRITGDPRWAEYSWQIFQAINDTSRTAEAFGGIHNVDMPFGGNMYNLISSFFFAEVLKYTYITQTDPRVINLDQWVFNTECHPVLCQCGIGGIDDYSGTSIVTNSSMRSIASMMTNMTTSISSTKTSLSSVAPSTTTWINSTSTSRDQSYKRSLAWTTSTLSW